MAVNKSMLELCILGDFEGVSSSSFKIDKMDTSFASIDGNVEFVKFLYEKMKAPFSSVFIDIACIRGHFDIVKYLFEVVKIQYQSRESFFADKETVSECFKRADIIRKYSEMEADHFLHRFIIPNKKSSIRSIENKNEEDSSSEDENEEIDGDSNPDILRAVDYAAIYEHIDILEYLINVVKIPCTKRTFNYAVGFEKLKSVKYLYEIAKTKYSRGCLILACELGNLEIVKYICEVMKVKYHEEALFKASQNGRTPVVAYLCRTFYPPIRDIDVLICAGGGKIGTLKFYLEAVGFPPKPDLLEVAISSNKLRTVAYLCEVAKIPITKRCIKIASGKVLEYLKDKISKNKNFIERLIF